MISQEIKLLKPPPQREQVVGNSHQKTLHKANEGNDYIGSDLYLLDRRTRQCPIDNYSLTSKPIAFINKNNQRKMLNTSVCTHCGRLFMMKDSIPESVKLEDYRIKIHHLSAKGQEDTAKAHLIKHPVYGIGKLIKEEQIDGRTVLTVDFGGEIRKVYRKI